jgi:AraC family transcriptional regulator, transcriptional activator of pobA
VSSIQIQNPIKPETPDFIIESLAKNITKLDFQLPSRMYVVLYIKEGEGEVKYDGNLFAYSAPCALFFAAYQPFIITSNTIMKGVTLQFATDFFCIDHNHLEVGCQGLLFNNAYDTSYIKLNENNCRDLDELVQKIRNEINSPEAVDADLVSTYLKLFLKLGVKEKKTQGYNEAAQGSVVLEKALHHKLRQEIEANFKSIKSPSEYADRLNVSSKNLAKTVKQVYGKTITDLIQERVIFEAKSLLFKTDKSIKEIAVELGFEDPSYFSRLFKNVTTVSPEKYRESIHF